jgi:CspA family cold shock protein
LVGSVAVGKVLRFDLVKGYGFIEPESGGEDVFLHVNDLLDDKHSIEPGTVVEFTVETAERGLKASGVQIVSRRGPSEGNSGVAPVVAPVRTSPGGGHDTDEQLCDVLSAKEFYQEITDLLLALEPSLTGRQILAIRDQFSRAAISHGWVEG